MTLLPHRSAKVSALIYIRACLFAAIFGSLLLASACARFMPADPYKNTQTVNVLVVPEGKVRPAVDPSLAVPEGKAVWTDNGHMPPAVANASAATAKTAPEIVEKTGEDE